VTRLATDLLAAVATGTVRIGMMFQAAARDCVRRREKGDALPTTLAMSPQGDWTSGAAALALEIARRHAGNHTNAPRIAAGGIQVGAAARVAAGVRTDGEVHLLIVNMGTRRGMDGASHRLTGMKSTAFAAERGRRSRKMNSDHRKNFLRKLRGRRKMSGELAT